MDTLTITIEGDHLKQAVLHVLAQLGNLPEVEYTQDGNQLSLKSADKSSGENYMLPGPPMTMEELIAQIEEAEADYEEGNYMTTQQVRKDAETW